MSDAKSLSSSQVFLRAIEELRILHIDIDGYINGYIEEWKEFSNDIETKMALQKRMYILVIRLLPKNTHKQLINQLIYDYKLLLKENREIIEDIKNKEDLEKSDIKIFDEWIENHCKGLPPIYKKYRDFMKSNKYNATDNGDVEVVTKKTVFKVNNNKTKE
jgi:hypothetical protein